ncbi:hypothetical protein V6N12_031712 [Hibiscus sabdariffa]|uniref:Uncharacterized protein n=1 Tax=Hibiscus sabdariffa TaxID=183260 RepID=A0ABR2DVB2_9ROSI
MLRCRANFSRDLVHFQRSWAVEEEDGSEAVIGGLRLPELPREWWSAVAVITHEGFRAPGARRFWTLR